MTDQGWPTPAGALLTIDLGALQHNWRVMRDRAAPARCGAAVKADAYGLGLIRAGKALYEAGCDCFFVSQAAEGADLRPHLGAADIYVLNGVREAALDLHRDYALKPVLNSLADIALWKRANLPLPAALHIDTGMARLGLPADEIEILAGDESWQAGLTLDLVMSHLSSADVPASPLNAEQKALFDTARARLGLTGVPASLANSAGVLLGADYHYDIVRPGLALYGANPVNGTASVVRQTVRLEAEIVQLRAVDAHTAVGYGAAHTTSGATRIATIPVGYGDGYPRTLSHVGTAELGGYEVPIVGRISMDLITLDVGAVPEDVAKLGARVTLIGGPIDLSALAHKAGTVSYELLTNLSRRIPRHTV